MKQGDGGRCTSRQNPPPATAAMNDDTLLPFDLPSVRRKKLTVDFAGGDQSSNGGLLLLREAERRLGVCRRLATAMPDRRDPDRNHPLKAAGVTGFVCVPRASLASIPCRPA